MPRVPCLAVAPAAPALMVMVMAIAILIAAACSPPEPPEQRIRELVARAVAAAEARDVPALSELIAEDYADDDGNDARRIALMLRGYFMQREGIHLLSRIEALEISGDFAELSVLVGSVASPSDGWGLVADAYQLRAELRERDGRWRVVRCEWRRGLAPSGSGLH